MNNQSWLPWWRDQQESTKSTCSTALSQVNVKSGQNIVVSLTSRCNIVVFQVQRWNCDWQSLQSVRHTEHRTGGANFQCKVKRSRLPSTTTTVQNLIIILRWSLQSCWWLSQCQWKDPVMLTKLCSNSLLYNYMPPVPQLSRNFTGHSNCTTRWVSIGKISLSCLLPRMAVEK